jgi:hypothetical protein
MDHVAQNNAPLFREAPGQDLYQRFFLGHRQPVSQTDNSIKCKASFHIITMLTIKLI